MKKNQINENVVVIYGGFSGKKLYDQIKSSNKITNIFIDDKNLYKVNITKKIQSLVIINF